MDWAIKMNENRVGKATLEQKARDALMRETQPEMHKLCQAGGTCDGDIVKGHLIPRSYMRRMTSSSQVKVFTKHRFGRTSKKFPMRAAISEAATGYFTCRKHEQIFQPADQVAITDDMPSQRILDLMAYREILHARWWMQLYAKASDRVADLFGFEKQRIIANKVRSDEPRLIDIQMRIEESFESKADNPRPLTHLVLSSRGKPVLVAARFGIGQEASIEQWGMTIVPNDDHNALCLHFAPEMGTTAIDLALPSLARGRTEISGEEITRAILSCCDDVVFSEESWDNLTDKEREHVLRAFGQSGNQLYEGPDLFKGCAWKIL